MTKRIIPKAIPAALILAAAVLPLAGCTAVEAITEATREKSVAAGADTWGGGLELSVATPEQPFPNLSGWFGRRRVWYVSVKDRETGEAAAEVVKAGHSGLKVEATAAGVALQQ